MALKTISGFRSIKILGGDLILDQLASLLEIDGFQMLTHVEGSLRISSCKLKNLDAMSNLRSVGEDFTISGNPEMTELYGENMVSLMEEVGRVFFVTGNDKLASIRNMPYFQSAGRLLISYNPQLVDIEGLSNLSNIAETFDVLDNPSLSQCAIESICRLLEEPGKVRIVANAAGCNSASEVATQCTNSINDSYREPLRIFPNPAVQHLYITTPTNSVPFSAFRIYTLNGRLVTTGYAGRDGLLDISTLEPGIYTIRKDAGMSGAVTSFIKL